MTRPEASVIIPTYRDWDRLQGALDSLARQTLPPERFEIIVANNNPDAAPPSTLRLPTNARVVHAPRPGSYAARNVALGTARGEVLFFTDSDCQPDTDWLRAGLAAIGPLGPHDRVAGAIELFARGRRWNLAEIYDRAMWLQQDLNAAKGWGVTANLIARRAAFDLVGLFRDDMFSGGDKDWNMRAAEKGSRIVYAPEAVVRHPARATFAELAQKHKRIIGGRHSRLSRDVRRRLPPLGYLFPSVKFTQRLFRNSSLSRVDKLKVWIVDYGLRFVTFKETIRLRYFKGQVHRQ